MMWAHETMIWLVCFFFLKYLSAFCSLWCQSIVETRQHSQSPCLHRRGGVWSPGAVLQLSVQELPQSASWCQPLLLHLPTGQLLPGARWLWWELSQTTCPCILPLRSGGWWVTLPCRRNLPNENIHILPLALLCASVLFVSRLLINNFGYTNSGRPPLAVKKAKFSVRILSRTTEQQKVISYDPVCRCGPSCVHFAAAGNTPMDWASVRCNCDFNGEAKVAIHLLSLSCCLFYTHTYPA